MTYPEARAYISSLQKRGWRLGLDRMTEFLRLIDNPHENLKVFHVAGTNGKGSVTAMLQNALVQAGFKVGSYYSPYVFDFRERIQLDGEMISGESVASLTEELRPISEQLASTYFGGPTEFEFITAMGFLYWARLRCDYIAVEVGLGGRLDATNVVNSIVSIITEIGLDHQQYLGDDLESIANEKAGIIRSGVPVVSGVTSPVARAVIRRAAENADAIVWQLGEEIEVCRDFIRTPVRIRHGLRTNLIGEFQRRNLAIAVAALDAVNIESDEDAFARIALPGRLQKYSERPFVILDGAHNPQAAKAVVEELKRPIRLVYSAAKGHDISATLSAFAPSVRKVYAAQMRTERGATLDEIVAAVPSVPVERYDSPEAAFEAAKNDWKDGEVVLVSGSFYLLGEALGL